MPSSFKQDSDPVKLRFGGGIHSRASIEDIDPRECTDGQNFDLDAGNLTLRPRKGFEKINDSALNGGASVLGGATLLKSDQTVSTLFQVGDTVYEWDGNTGVSATFTNKGTVNASAKLRGRLEHQWPLSDKVIITDLTLNENVNEWDGTTFQNVTFTDECDAAFGTFKAKYCYVDKERAVFANINDGSNFPHLIVGSQRGDYTQITVSNRPAGALSDQDPFFLVQPDNFPINGIKELFGDMIMSSNQGSLFKMVGSNAKDFDIVLIAVRNAADGDEPMVVTASDLLYGTVGSIESLRATEKFGDVDVNDLSFWIRDSISDYNDWTLVHNRRTRRTFCYSNSTSELWVFHHAIFERFNRELSPWSKWVTSHAIDFDPTFMMNLLDPSDGLEYVFMGDGSGNIYKLEGSGTGDPGSTSVNCQRTSILYSAIAEGKISDLLGYIRYTQNGAVSLDLDFEFQGEHNMTNTVTFSLPSGSNVVRQKFGVPGAGNDLQITTKVNDVDDWNLNEVGFRYVESSE